MKSEGNLTVRCEFLQFLLFMTDFSVVTTEIFLLEHIFVALYIIPIIYFLFVR